MKRAGLSLFLWLLVLPSVGGIHDLFAQNVVILSDNGDPANRLDLVILGDGYTNAEIGKFASDVDNFISLAFAQEPFREYQRYFNIRRIDVASAQSGADHPELNPPVFRDTAFDAAYNCGGIQRTICVSSSKVDAAVSVLPAIQRDLIIVIVNDSQYGGSGGRIAVASTNSASVEILLHELGHSLGLLTDEYGTGINNPPCDDSVEPAEANATKQTVRASIKWGVWIDASTPIPTTTVTGGVPGLYAGARYCDITLYRPTYNSKMRSLSHSFEQINSEQLIRRFYNWVRPIDSVQPVASQVSVVQGQTQLFSLITPTPFTHNLGIKWSVDGIVQSTSFNFVLNSGAFSAGAHTVSVQVKDTTPMVRNDPSQLLVGQAKWSLTITSRGMNDDFNGNSLDPRLWSLEASPVSSSVAVTNQRLEISLGAGAGGAGIVSRCSVGGDFDVQVDYILLSWPPRNPYGLRLGAVDLGVGPFGEVAIQRNSSTVSSLEFYTMVFTDNAQQTPTTDRAGKLRLVRNGSFLSGWFCSSVVCPASLDGTNWRLVGAGQADTRPTRFNLDIGTTDPNAPGGILIAFDNFQVNAGTSVCPVARDDSYTMRQGTVLTVPAPGVLANDTIPPGVTATVEFVTFPPAGLTNLGSGGFILDFRPNPTFVGTVVFNYLFHTAQGDSNIATVTVQVTP